MRSPGFLRKSMKIIGSKKSALEIARGRLVLVSALFALAYIMIAARVFDLTFIQGEMRSSQTVSVFSIPSEGDHKKIARSDIFDRNNTLLATSLETPSLYADPALIQEPEQVARDLVAILPDVSYGDILQKLQRKGRFIWLKRNLVPQEQSAILALGYPGLGFKNEWRRIYPQGSLLSHMVGFTDVDGYGLAGVERSFERLLIEGDEPLVLTLDVRLQHIVRRELARAIDVFDAQGGGGLVLDMANGDVLAAVSLPDFDPHEAAETKNALFNRLTLGVYELGSVFKIFSTAALLDTLDVSMGTTFDARKPIKSGRFSISDYHAEKRVLNVPEVFVHSSNIGSALMGEMIGTDVLRSFYDDLGLLERPSLEINEIGKPLYPRPWRDINTLTASYGHGIAVSPLQMAAAASSVVNGTLVKTSLILDQSAAEKTQNSPVVRIVSPQTAHRMRQLLRLVVTDGTGKQADVPGYRVGGKTGTAEQPSARGGYDRKKLISSFMGFFPMEAPRYAILVFVDQPQGTKASFGYATGGWVAAPAAANIIKSMATVLAIPPVATTAEKDMAASLKKYLRERKARSGLASFRAE